MGALGQNQPGLALNRSQYAWAKIYLKIVELAMIGGTDYRTIYDTLITDATNLAKTMGPYQRRIAWLNILRNNAIAAGATPTTAPPLFLGEINEATSCCLQPATDMEAIDMLLTCRLGVHKAYPQ